MSKKEHLENIIVGSLLNDRSKLRDCALVTSDTMTEANRELYDIIKTSAYDQPLEEVFSLVGIISPSTFVHALDLSAFWDFDTERNKYNLHAHIKLLRGQMAQYTDVTFSDYVTRYLRLCYQTTETPK